MVSNTVFGAALLGAAIVAAPAQAAFVTSLTGGTAITMPAVNYQGSGPQAFGPMTFTSDSSRSVFGYVSGYGFGSNGSWIGGPLVGLNAGSNGAAYASMAFTFATPTSGILAEINWALNASQNNSVLMRIFDAAGNELEPYVVLANNGNSNTLTPNRYYGFQRVQADIAKFTLSNGYIAARNFSYIAPSLAAVPEPASWAFLALGFGLAGHSIRRRGARKVVYA